MTATLLPNAKQQFISGNGVPLVGGSVYFYIPNTSTLKNTWTNSNETTLNTNPVILNASGEAIIYGSGAYRQVVYDALGNLIWDALTQDVTQAIQSSVALFCGTSTGTANAQVLTPNPAVTSILTGQQFSFFAGFTNTGPTTIEISALTYNLYYAGAALTGNSVLAGGATLIQFDGTNMELINGNQLPVPGDSGNLLQSNGTIWTSAAPLLPPPGTSGNILTSTGTAWVSATPQSVAPNIQTFSTAGSATWTAPTGFSANAPVFIECWGAGGSGAGGAGQISGGGGGGSYKSYWTNLSALTSPTTITIGAGGASVSMAVNGNNGGNSSFGALVVGYGGVGGEVETSGIYGSGGGSGGLFSTSVSGTPQNDSSTGEGYGGFYTVATTSWTVANNGNILGGGGGSGSASQANSRGGNSVYGGGGGAGVVNPTGIGIGGISIFAGNGGNDGAAGLAPSGGGGAHAGASGKGGDGQVRVTVFI